MSAPPRPPARLPAWLAIALLLLAALAPAAQAEERILSFVAELVLQPDGSLHVVETIEVQAEGREIRRGIRRDFPLRSLTELGLNRRAAFRLERVEHDGAPAPYFLGELNAGIRITVGQEDVFLAPGPHRYTFAYVTDPQLLGNDEIDELYWNVTGSDWTLPIERAETVVHLPERAGAALAVAGYTGPTGASGGDVRLLQNGDGIVRMATTRRLEPGEGFTIALSWPAGLVARPDPAASLVLDNPGLLAGLAATALLLAYLLWAWRRVGRDPEGGPIIPLFEPPAGLSPVATGLLWHGGFDSGFSRGTALATVLTGLATKGALTIAAGQGSYTLTPTGGKPAGLSEDEAAVLAALFPGQAEGEAAGGGKEGMAGAAPLTFGRGFEPRIGAAQAALNRCFGFAWRRRYHRTNLLYWLPGAVLAVATTLGVLAIDAQGVGAIATILFMLLFAAGFAGPALFIVWKVLAQWSGRARGGSAIGFLSGLFMLAMALAFLVPAGWILVEIADMVSPVALAVAVLPLPVAILFRHWMEAPTPLGRQVLDGIAGYRRYLSVAEGPVLNQAGREVPITEALYEAHLPYAMALGVEREWTERFAAQARAAGMQPDEDGGFRYRPRWFRAGDGQAWSSPAAVARSLSSGLGGAASRAATRPASSSRAGSASSGRGFSGGGAGGGGGSGW